MPIRFNFELKWGEAAKKPPTVTPPPSPAPSKKESSSSSCSCSSSSSSSSSSYSSSDSKKANKSAAKSALKKTNYTQLIPRDTLNPRPLDPKVIFVRSSECVEQVFASWMKLANCCGQYRRYNANMPFSIPQRLHGLQGFLSDSPLTCLGQKMSFLIASAIHRSGIVPEAIYCAPPLR